MADEMELGIRLAMESQDFQKQITGINREMKVVQAEFNAASSALGDFGNEEQKLEGKSASLTQQIQMSQQKVDLLTAAHEKSKQKLAENVALNDELRQSLARSTAAYQQSAAATGENSAESLRLKTAMDALNSQYATSNSLILRNATSADNLNIRLQNTRTAQNRLQNELTQTTTDLEAQRNSMNDLGGSANRNGPRFEAFGEKLKTMGKAAAVGITAIATAFAAVVTSGAKTADDLAKALNGVQASTGAADSEMGGLKDTMTEVYGDNFGEGFTEIGDAMTLISQQTGQTGDALKKTTENALLLKDTFKLEVEDSILGANQLMKQFGLDSEASYNLIAQGAQKGLNANGDLIDTLNEYGGTFKAQGFSAEEMFNMLGNASKSGVRNIDLAADAIKEFGIRSKDGSTTSADGFKAIGLNAGAMTKEFAKGGDSAKAAFDKTVKGLLGMKDPVKQNAAGVALFGTQFEDLGIKGVTALVNTNGSIKTTTDALKKINEVKYNTLGESIEGIKRQLITGIVIPLGEKVLPSMNQFANYIKTNMPAIQNEVSYAMGVMSKVFDGIGRFVQTFIIPIFKAFSDLIAANMPQIRASILNMYNSVKPSFDKLVGIIKSDLMPIIQGLWGLIKSAMPTIKVIFEVAMLAIGAALRNAMDAIGIFIQIAKSIYDLISGPINDVIYIFNQVAGAIQWALDKLGIWNKTPAQNKNATVTTDYNDHDIPKNAMGTSNWRGGLTWVGEQGPELVRLPSGSQVKTNKESMEIAGKQSERNSDISGTIVVPVILDGKIIARVVAPLIDLIQGKGVSVAGRAVGV